ncbi:MAG: hypothetical protein ACKOXF_02650 [Chitinophagaceae bacterium]
MKFFRAILLIILFTGVNSFAQINDYFNIKEVKTYRFDHLNISSEKDIITFTAGISDYNFIEALKISNTSEVNQALSVVRQCYGLKEINLIDYHGNFNEQTFDSCTDIEILHLSISEEKLDQLQFLKELPKLQTLFLYIIGKPESTAALKKLPTLRELHIIGDFLPADLNAIASIVTNNQGQLKQFGLSVDRVTDLPQSITSLKMLDKLILYDNLSVFTNKGIDDLSEEKISIMFDLFSDLVSAVAISYCSNNGTLSDYERDFLQSLYKGELVSQQLSETDVVAEDGFTIPFKKEFIPDFPVTPEFNSPYSSIRPAEEIFIINPGNNSILHTQSGMTVSIAAGSFINENSEPVKDPVYIRIIQINKPTEILFAGLNMANSGNQFTNQFLFNIQATAEKSAARLKEGYQMKVNMPVAADSSIAHFYDYESSTWQNLNFYNEIFAGNFEPIDFHKMTTSPSTQSLYLFDTTNFDSRFRSSHSTYLNDKDNKSQLLFKNKSFYSDLDRTWIRTYNQNGKLSGIRIKKGKSYIKIQKVIPKERNKARQYFKLLDKTEQNIYPELKAFSKLNFNVPVNTDNKKEFNDNYIRNVKYNDVRISYSRGKDYCEILLKTNEGYRKLIAYITDSDNKEIIKKQLKKFNKCYDKYLKIVGKKRLEFNDLNQIRFQEFRQYTSEKTSLLEKNGQFPELKIHQLGTFGMFYSQTPVFNTSLIAQYTDQKGLPIDIKNIYMIDNRYNTVFKIQVGNLNFEPNNCDYMIATDYSGNLYYANKNDILASAISNNSLIYIKLKKVSSNVSDINTFNNILKN